MDRLAKLSGISLPDLKAIAEQVKANSAALNGCARHSFEAMQPGVIGTRHRCGACGGTVDSSALHWYMRGLAHAGGA